jgi:endonuclease YncB( thermonuclease family)
VFKLDVSFAGALVALAIIIPVGAFAAATSANAATTSTKSFDSARAIYWSDGDSGRLPDGTRFRLHGVDAPETGSLGRRGGAKCESERELGYTAKAQAVTLTRGAAITVMRDYGKDRYGRTVVDIAIDGADVGAALLAAGTHQAWNYDARKPKPDWCPPKAASPAQS